MLNFSGKANTGTPIHGLGEDDTANRPGALGRYDRESPEGAFPDAMTVSHHKELPVAMAVKGLNHLRCTCPAIVIPYKNYFESISFSHTRHVFKKLHLNLLKQHLAHILNRKNNKMYSSINQSSHYYMVL